jgi:hypothetical protein
MAKKPVTPDEISAKKTAKKKAPARRVKRGASTTIDPRSIDHDTRRSLVATEAYYRAERRGFTAGHELEDWVAAERAIDLALAGHSAS